MSKRKEKGADYIQGIFFQKIEYLKGKTSITGISFWISLVIPKCIVQAKFFNFWSKIAKIRKKCPKFNVHFLRNVMIVGEEVYLGSSITVRARIDHPRLFTKSIFRTRFWNFKLQKRIQNLSQSQWIFLNIFLLR